MKEYKARDKTVLKMTRDGLIEETKATGEVKNISTRDAELSFAGKREIDALKNSSRTGRRQQPSILQSEQPTATPPQPGQALIGEIAEKSPLPLAADNPAKKDTGTAERVIDRVDTEKNRHANKRTVKRANEEIRKQGQRPSRLQFTDEERADPALDKVIHKSDKAADNLDKAQAKIPKRNA